MNSPEPENCQGTLAPQLSSGHSSTLPALPQSEALLHGVDEPIPGQEPPFCFVPYKPTLDPSRREYESLADSFDYFNRIFFFGQLPQPMFTLNHRAASAKGHLREDRFSLRVGPWKSRIHVSEISLNPRAMVGKSDMEILADVVHQMTHLCQFLHRNEKKPPRVGYHNDEWASLMEERGLVSSTGEPGGKRTGQKMSQYVFPGGPFELACRALLDSGWRLDWDAAPDRPQAPGNRAKAIAVNDSKTKFTCPECQQNAWARPRAYLVCGHCGLRMTNPAQAGKALGPIASGGIMNARHQPGPKVTGTRPGPARERPVPMLAEAIATAKMTQGLQRDLKIIAPPRQPPPSSSRGMAVADLLKAARPTTAFSFILTSASTWGFAFTASATAGDGDIFSSAFHSYADTTGRMSMALLFWFIRVAAVLVLQVILLSLTLKAFRPTLGTGATIAAQWAIFVLTWSFSGSLPLRLLHVWPTQKGWIFAVAMVVIIVLPPRLARLLVPIELWRRVVAGCLYGLLAVLLAIQLLIA